MSFSYILYIKLSFFQKFYQSHFWSDFHKISPLKFKFNIVSYSNFEIILQFFNNSKLNSKFIYFKFKFSIKYIVNYDVKKCEILEQQITTSKLEGIHNCADRTDKFVSNYAYSDVE